MDMKIVKRNALIVILSLVVLFLLVCVFQNVVEARNNTKNNYMYFSNDDGAYAVDLVNDEVCKWDVENNNWVVVANDVVRFFEGAPIGKVSFN